ncbi:hypothetical protein [Legionella cardiaca]|uniref:Uncharacterized protein n=1 Tax=Legionella cardiaca TaxID=1071983 RepID=A0ABY8AUZ5_9GAMM|nr:hypothetical protein [Legionella cardiaca]WED44510.1 hypothetical protein PXX05_06915 [Legionella cardiaca]
MKKIVFLLLIVGSTVLLSSCGCCGTSSCGGCGSYTVACCGSNGWY